MTGSRQSVPRTSLEQLLRQRDQTYEEAATEFAEIGADLRERGASITARHLRRLASGERTGTNPITRRVLRHMFGRPVAELLGPYAPESDAPPRSHGQVEETSVDREEEVLQVAAERARRFGMVAGRVGVNEETLEQIYDDVRALAVAYQQRPLHEILGTLVNTQEVVFSLLEQRTKPAQTRVMYFLAGTISGLLARVSHDHANPHSAMTHARTAFICADNADHNGLRAWVRGLESVVAYWVGRPQDALRYAQSGAEFALRAANSAAVWIPANEGRAWAALGNGPQTLDAIRRAETAWDTVVADDLDDLGGVFRFSRPRQLYYAADALAWLPSEAPMAEQYATEAVAAYADPTQPDWRSGTRRAA